MVGRPKFGLELYALSRLIIGLRQRDQCDWAIQITYAGQITSDDEIRFTRKVADFATEELFAKRVK